MIYDCDMLSGKERIQTSTSTMISTMFGRKVWTYGREV